MNPLFSLSDDALRLVNLAEYYTIVDKSEAAHAAHLTGQEPLTAESFHRHIWAYHNDVKAKLNAKYDPLFKNQPLLIQRIKESRYYLEFKQLELVVQKFKKIQDAKIQQPQMKELRAALQYNIKEVERVAGLLGPAMAAVQAGAGRLLKEIEPVPPQGEKEAAVTKRFEQKLTKELFKKPDQFMKLLQDHYQELRDVATNPDDPDQRASRYVQHTFFLGQVVSQLCDLLSKPEQDDQLRQMK